MRESEGLRGCGCTFDAKDQIVDECGYHLNARWKAVEAGAAGARSSASGDSAAVQELRNIADAKRFNREMFRDDEEFANWAQSRCRHTLAKYVGAQDRG